MMTKTMTDQSSEKKPRLPLTERVDGDRLPPFRLTKRDQEIVAAVYTHRALTTPQIETLFFPDSKYTRCSRRLKRLFHYGFLERDEQAQTLTEGRRPLVYFLDEKGAQLLCHLHDLEPDEIDWHPRENQVGHRFIEHLLATNDVRVAIEVAADRNGWTIETWLNEKTLKSREAKDYVELTGPRGGKRRAAVVPDGYFVFRADEYVYHHLVEVDRRTVVGQAKRWRTRDWARKIRVYLAYYKSGKYQERYETKSLRVLTVTTGERRLANLKEITEDVGGKSRFWFTTFDLATPKNVLTEPIWQKAGSEGLVSLTW